MCTYSNKAEDCTCSDEERAFTHTYITPETKVAMTIGYLLLQVHKRLHWEETELYDPVTKE